MKYENDHGHGQNVVLKKIENLFANPQSFQKTLSLNNKIERSQNKQQIEFNP